MAVSLDAATKSVAVGATVKLNATVTPDNATNKAINWTSSDETKATVSKDGTVTGKVAGTVTITATSADNASAKATCAVTVTADANK